MPTESRPDTSSRATDIDRTWWRNQGADACIDRMILILERAEKAERDLAEVRRMHKQMCEIAVERFNEIERLTAARPSTAPLTDAEADKRLTSLENSTAPGLLLGVLKGELLMAWKHADNARLSAPSHVAASTEKELLDKCIMALSGQYVNDEDASGEKAAWNSAVGYCIGALRTIQEQLPAQPSAIEPSSVLNHMAIWQSTGPNPMVHVSLAIDGRGFWSYSDSDPDGIEFAMAFKKKHGIKGAGEVHVSASVDGTAKHG